MGRIIFSVATHYSYTAAYNWMLFSGLYLIRAARNDALKQMTIYYVLSGWSLPVPLIAVMVGINVNYYGVGFRRLPSVVYGYLWIYVGVFFMLALVSLCEFGVGSLTVHIYF